MRLIRSPSAVSVSFWICKPPLWKVANSRFEATRLLLWTVSESTVRVHRNERIFLSKGCSSCSVVGSAMSTWLYSGTMAEFIRGALCRMSWGGVVASILLFIDLRSIFEELLTLCFPWFSQVLFQDASCCQECQIPSDVAVKEGPVMCWYIVQMISQHWCLNHWLLCIDCILYLQ